MIWACAGSSYLVKSNTAHGNVRSDEWGSCRRKNHSKSSPMKKYLSYPYTFLQIDIGVICDRSVSVISGVLFFSLDLIFNVLEYFKLHFQVGFNCILILSEIVIWREKQDVIVGRVSALKWGILESRILAQIETFQLQHVTSDDW